MAVALLVGIKKNSVYNIFGMAVALLWHPGGMKNFHFVTIFLNSDGRLHFVRRHPLSYENKTATHRALRALVFLIMLLRYESKLSTS